MNKDPQWFLWCFCALGRMKWASIGTWEQEGHCCFGQPSIWTSSLLEGDPKGPAHDCPGWLCRLYTALKSSNQHLGIVQSIKCMVIHALLLRRSLADLDPLFWDCFPRLPYNPQLYSSLPVNPSPDQWAWSWILFFVIKTLDRVSDQWLLCFLPSRRVPQWCSWDWEECSSAHPGGELK